MSNSLLRTSLALIFLLLISSVLSSQTIQWSGANFISRNTAEVAVSDVDGDGFNDVLIAGGQQRWYKGPAFEEWFLIGLSDGGPYAAQAADMNGDGYVDFVTSDGARNEGDIPGHTYVYLHPGVNGDPTEEWERIIVYAGNVRHQNDMDIVDLDNDGLLDIVTRSWSEERVVVALQNPDIYDWTVRPFIGNPDKEEGLSAGDVDGDGEMELVLSGIYWDNPGGWRTGEPIPYSVDPNFVGQTFGKVKSQVGDIDNDGDNDIYMASAEGSNRYMAWYENEGTDPNTGGVLLTKHIILDNSGKFHMVQLIDVDQDGDLDMCTGRSFGENGLFVFYNNNNGESWTEQNYDTGGEIYTGVVADLDADGDLDVVGPSRYNNGSVRYYFNETPVGPPVAPNNLVVSLINGLQIDLNWEDASDNETGFEIERFESGVWTPLDITLSNATAYADDSTQPSSTYQYRVRAVNIAGTSDWIESTSLTTFNQAGEVSISPSGGSYTDAQSVTISAVQPYDVIYYTLDGSVPNASSLVYSDPLDVDESLTLRAIALGDGLIPSAEQMEEYNIAIDGNFPPVANAGADGNGEINASISLSGAGSTDLNDDLNSLSFSWTQITTLAVSITDANEENASFTPLEPGEYIFELEVSDGSLVHTDQVVFLITDPEAVPGPDPLFHWPMNETEGAVAEDIQGGFNASLNSGMSLGNDSQVGGALLCNGEDGRATTAPVDVSGTSMSISFWMNATDLNEVEARMISKASGTNENTHYFMVSQIGGTGLRFRLKTDAQGTETLASPADELEPNQWYFVVATYDGSFMRLYKNGTEIASTAQTGELTLAPTVPMCIGNQPEGAGDRPFAGLLDEVKVYGVDLTETEITDLYNFGLNPIDTTEDCFGDVNGDGFITASDLSSVLSLFGTICNNCPQDLNQNNVIDISDVTSFLLIYGTSCD